MWNISFGPNSCTVITYIAGAQGTLQAISDVMAFKCRSQSENPELVIERAKSSFKAIELTNILDDGPLGTERRHEAEQLCIDNPNLKTSREFISLSCDDHYSKAIEARTKVPQEFKDVVPMIKIVGRLDCFINAHVSSIASPMGDPLITHGYMFVPTILGQATEEQQAMWLPLIGNNTIIGTFCMTELGHGTNIRSLETTATYDPKTEEFVLNSPTLTSLKCWPGGLAKTCNSAVVFAQLYSKGQCYGLHPFFIQLRNYEDHRVLPGIKLGLIGPKMGINSIDNGYAKFDHVKVPRNNMLMKYPKLLPDGTYIKSDSTYASSNTLQLARYVVVLNALLRVAQASAIAIRYSAVRRQGHLEPGDALEIKILDYKTQQRKLFPHVAFAYAGLITCKKLFRIYEDLVTSYTDKKAGEIHALLGGMKGFCSDMANVGINDCRQACGGYGYLKASHLPFLSTYVSGLCTLDGVNTVLLLQTARYLLKGHRFTKEGNGDLSSFTAYLNLQFSDVSSASEDDSLILLQRTTAGLIAQISDRMELAVANGTGLGEAWNDNTPDLVKCSRFHMMTIIIDAARNYLFENNISSSLRVVLQHLFDLLALYWMQENAGDFMQYGAVSASMMEKFNTRLFDLFVKLRPAMVTLVDAFDFRDEALQSVIGCYDGRVYERMYEYMTTLPSNQTEVHPVFEKYLKPMRNSKL